MLLLETVTSLASIGTALFFSWKLTLVILATFPVAAGLLYFISKGVGPAIERQKRELSKASKYASNAVTAIDSVKAFNGQDQEVWQYFLTAKAITKYYLIQARSNAFRIIKFFAVGLYVSTFWFGLYLVIHGSSTVGHVLTTFVSCAFAMQAAEIVLPQFLVLAKGISAGETLKSIMAEMQDGRSTKNENGDLIPDVCPGDIEINDVGKLSSLDRMC
jgi:ATP-binding cassette, subfamily B (MDR/TAP), member 1